MSTPSSSGPTHSVAVHILDQDSASRTIGNCAAVIELLRGIPLDRVSDWINTERAGMGLWAVLGTIGEVLSVAQARVEEQETELSRSRRRRFIIEPVRVIGRPPNESRGENAGHDRPHVAAGEAEIDEVLKSVRHAHEALHRVESLLDQAQPPSADAAKVMCGALRSAELECQNARTALHRFIGRDMSRGSTSAADNELGAETA